MTWNTTNIEAEVAELKARGVVFEEYDLPEVKTINSVATLGESNRILCNDVKRKGAKPRPELASELFC